jgi:hypothetical protein
VSRSIRKVQELLQRVEAREAEVREAELSKAWLGILAPFLGKGQ